MARVSIPITVDQLFDVVQQLPLEEQRALMDKPFDHRFTTAMADAHKQQADRPELSNEEIQAEIDAVRRQHRQERLRASGD